MEYNDQNLQKRLNDLKNLDQVNKENAEALHDFYSRINVDDDIGNERIYKYLGTWKTLFNTSEKYSSENLIHSDIDLRNAEKKDWLKVTNRIKRSSYSQWSKSDFKTCIKKFYNTLYPDEFDRPKNIKKILSADFLKKPSNIENKRETKALTAQEIKDMQAEANNARDKLLPVFLFETGARISEVMGREAQGYECEGIKLKDVELKQKYADVDVPTIKNKNKDSKKLQLVRSIGLLKEWLERHPRSDVPEAPLFVNISREKKGESVSKKRISTILKNLAEKAGIDKPIRNHVFRHSSATFKATELGWNQARLLYWHGWSDPDMAKKYQKDDEDRMRSARLEEEGIEDADSQKDAALDIRECPRCETSVDPFASFCPQCSLALDHETAQETQNTSDAVKEDLIDEIRQELGLSEAELEQKIREKTREHKQGDSDDK